MRRLSQFWRGIALVPAAGMLVHQLRYFLAYGGGADGALSEQGHAYLSSLTPWIIFLCAAALGAFLGRLARAWRLGEPETRSTSSPVVVWLVAAAGLVTLYTGQELLEGLLAAGHPPGLIGVFGDGGWWAIPAALFVAGLLTLGLRGAGAAVRFVASRRVRSAGSRRLPPSSTRAPAVLLRPPLAPMAAAAPGRAPPPPLPS